MPKSLNRVELLGNVGKDPEVKFTPSGTAVAKFSMATTSRYKDKNGDWQDKVEWHNIVCWARLAEIAGEYVHKGDKLYIEGRMETSSWEDKQTQQRKYMTSVVASDLILLGNRQHESAGDDAETVRRQGRGEERTGREGTPTGPGNEADDSDLPF
jgi:single-strand DNA-binding protein